MCIGILYVQNTIGAYVHGVRQLAQNNRAPSTNPANSKLLSIQGEARLAVSSLCPRQCSSICLPLDPCLRCLPCLKSSCRQVLLHRCLIPSYQGLLWPPCVMMPCLRLTWVTYREGTFKPYSCNTQARISRYVAGW